MSQNNTDLAAEILAKLHEQYGDTIAELRRQLAQRDKELAELRAALEKAKLKKELTQIMGKDAKARP